MYKQKMKHLQGKDEMSVYEAEVKFSLDMKEMKKTFEKTHKDLWEVKKVVKDKEKKIKVLKKELQALTQKMDKLQGQGDNLEEKISESERELQAACEQEGRLETMMSEMSEVMERTVRTMKTYTVRKSQPPKKKGSSKKPPKARTPTLIDGLTKEEMSKEQLEEHIVRLREELDRVREERNYFQLERDMIRSFWENAERKKEAIRAEQENQEKVIEDEESHHQVELKVYKQKMKHLLCEHQNTISELKAESLVSTEEQQREQEQLEMAICKEINAVMVDMQKNSNENIIKELEMKHEAEMAETRKRLETQLTEMKDTYETKMKLLEQELENMRKNEVSEREDHWNNHITALKEDHNKALDEAREFVSYVPPLLEDTDSLKADINEMKMKLKEKKRDVIPVLQDNKRLAEQLHKIREDHAKIEKQMKHRVLLKDTSEKIKEKRLKDLKCDYEALEQKFSKLQVEKDELYKTYTQSIDKVQDIAAMRSMFLDTKLKELTDVLVKTETQLHSVLSLSNMDHTSLCEVIKKAEEKLDSSNVSIRNLENRKAQVSKTRKDLLMTYEAKLRALGIPVEEPC